MGREEEGKVREYENQTIVISSGTVLLTHDPQFTSFVFVSDSSAYYGLHYTISSDSLIILWVDPSYDSLFRISGTGGIKGRWFAGAVTDQYTDSLLCDYTDDSLILSSAHLGTMSSVPCIYPRDGLYIFTPSNSSASFRCYAIVGTMLYTFDASNDQLVFIRK